MPKLTPSGNNYIGTVTPNGANNSSTDCVTNYRFKISTSDTYTSNNQPSYIDKNIKITVNLPDPTISVYTTGRIKKITSAGWAGKNPTSGGGNLSNWTCSLNANDLQNGHIITFFTRKYWASANSQITLSITSSLNKNFSSPVGYCPRYDNHDTYMCYAMNDGSGPNGSSITDLCTNSGNWYVKYSNGCYAYARRSGVNYDLPAGSVFSKTYSSVYHSGYWSGTPGNRRWNSGYWSYNYKLIVNGNTIWDSSTNFYIFAYSPNPSVNGNVLYIY